MTKTDLSFSIEEYEGRLARVRELMRERSIDVAILDEIESMGWLSGFAVSENLWRACVVPFEGAPFMLIRSLDLPPARERSWFSDIISFTDWEDPVECLVAELGRRGFAQSRIGIDFYSQSMPHGRLEQLRRVCPHATIVDFGRGIWELRLKKSPAEIDHLRSAAAIVDAAMRVAIENVKLGSSQQDVAAAVAFAYHKLGADDAFIGPLTSGNDWDSLHGHLQLKPFTAGDVFYI